MMGWEQAMIGFGAIVLLLVLLVKLAVIVAVIWLVAVIIRKIADPVKTKSTEHDKSLQILKERFARGEISEEEYKKMKTTLGIK
ncbi:hypothetical protein EWI07_10300 [Sporolactobacillus sp. THM7-4]|nr:hypothetical protein EWI07_10300 [Sporolactobacillus sp. THM7-4]